VIAIDDFFVSLFTTSLAHGEILTEIRIPIPPAKSGGAYFKLERKVGDFATAAVAVQLTLDGAGAVRKAGIGLTNVGGTPIRAKRAEEALRGKKLDAATIGAAAQAAADSAQPSSDLRGPAAYKTGLIKELTKRALARAAERAGK
jgi:carbon-monoxide dehydrogenase medium subunit